MNVSEFDVVVIGSGIVGSTLALGLAKKGIRTALVERGEETLSDQLAAQPAITCPERLHLGCTLARNQVAGGNGYYWGGGLIRPLETGLESCLGLSGSGQTDDLARHFNDIERELGVRRAPSRARFPVLASGVGPVYLSEIAVLPARTRNVSRASLGKFASIPGCALFTSSELHSFTSGGQHGADRSIESIVVDKLGEYREITAGKYLIAAGTVDSNLLVLSHAEELGLELDKAILGTGLHDHWSVPIGRVRISSDTGKALIGPHVDGPLIIGRRFELQCKSGWGAKGFLHFPIRFDDVSPYREVRRLMSLRQQRSPLVRLAKESLALLPLSAPLFRIAFERFVNGRIHLSDELAIGVSIDFETFPHPANAISCSAQRANLNWDLRGEDEISFIDLVTQARHLLMELSEQYGVQVEFHRDFSDSCQAIDHLWSMATDAFHLGGGITVEANGVGSVDRNLRLKGTTNVYVVSAAVMRRPGGVNPTLTLLALANRLVNQCGG